MVSRISRPIEKWSTKVKEKGSRLGILENVIVNNFLRVNERQTKKANILKLL